MGKHYSMEFKEKKINEYKKVNPEIIKTFGFNSMRDINKFEKTKEYLEGRSIRPYKFYYSDPDAEYEESDSKYDAWA